MDEGFFTLLFIFFMILVSVMDAVGRKKKKQRRMEQMEQAEEESSADRGRGGVDRGDARAPTAARNVPGSEGDVAEGSDRETADAMVPEDFWAILTGQPRPEKPEAEVPAEMGSRSGDSGERGGFAGVPLPETDQMGRRSEPAPPEEPRIPAPVPGGRMSSSASQRQTPDAAPTRRSARWMEGVDEAAQDRGTGDLIQAEEALVYADMDEPWDDLEDITAGDLTTEDKPSGARPGSGARKPRPRRGGPARPYTEFLESGNVEDLRKAIVLREVLGRPVAFRQDIGNTWME
jgi:hypothetical protein